MDWTGTYGAVGLLCLANAIAKKDRSEEMERSENKSFLLAFRTSDI